MNIGPVQYSPGNIDVSESVRSLRAAPARQPVAVSPPAKAVPVVAPSSSIVQDVVKLQWDSSEHVRIYQFVNRSGALILQVPSQQVLNVTRGIKESLNEASARRQTLQEEALQQPVPPNTGAKE